MRRLEITVTAEVPEDEHDRAMILANPEVVAARKALVDALSGAGVEPTVTTRTIQAQERPAKRGLRAAAE